MALIPSFFLIKYLSNMNNKYKSVCECAEEKNVHSIYENVHIIYKEFEHCFLKKKVIYYCYDERRMN